jgi:hypothetical protein
MKAKLQCFIDWLEGNRADAQAWQILYALANETLKVVESADPAQREFNVQDLAQACQPERQWDFDAAKRWFTRAAVPTYLDARRSEIDVFFRARGHDQSLAVTQRKSTGKYKTQWYLSPYDLESVEISAGNGASDEINPPATSTGMVAPDLIYEFTPPGQVKLSMIGRLLLGQGAFVTRSARGLLWAALAMGSLLTLLACLYLFWTMSRIQRPLTTSDLIIALMLIAAAGLFWRYLVRPWVWLVEDRIVPAGELLAAWSEAPAHLDMAKDDKHRYIRLVRYGGVCPVCAGTIELLYGRGANSRRLFGCCAEAPHDHVFTFDRVTRIGYRYL